MNINQSFNSKSNVSKSAGLRDLTLPAGLDMTFNFTNKLGPHIFQHSSDRLVYI